MYEISGLLLRLQSYVYPGTILVIACRCLLLPYWFGACTIYTFALKIYLHSKHHLLTKGSKFGELKMVSNSSKSAQKSRKPCWKQKISWGGMPPNPPRNAQRLRRARDMSSTCAWRPLLVLHNFPVFSLLLSIMPVTMTWTTVSF